MLDLCLCWAGSYLGLLDWEPVCVGLGTMLFMLDGVYVGLRSYMYVGGGGGGGGEVVLLWLAHSSNITLVHALTSDSEVWTFTWQQKVFSQVWTLPPLTCSWCNVNAPKA